MNIGTLTIMLGVTTSGMNKAIRDVGRLERSVAMSVKGINGQLLAFSRVMTQFATFPTVVLGSLGTSAFSKFEYNLSKITGILGIAKDQTNQWGKEILSLAPKIGASATAMSDAMYFIVSSNPQRAVVENMQILEASAKAAEAGLGDVKVVADTVTSVLNAYGSENISAAEAVDILIYGIREGKVEAMDFAKTIGKVLPIASKLGMEFEEVAAAAAMLGRTGTNAAEATTQVRRMLMTLVQQPAKGKEALVEFNSSYNDLINTLRNKGLLALMMEINNMSEMKGEEFMAQIFPNIRALLPVMDILGENMEENIGIMQRSKQIGGELDKMWGNYTETVRYSIRQAFSMAGVTMIEFGNQIKGVVIPILSMLVQGLRNLISWFSNLSTETKDTIAKITLLAAAFGPVYLALSSLVTVIMSVIKVALIPLRIAFFLVAGAVKILIGGLKGLRDVMASLKGLALANPYVLLAGALIAVGYAFMKVKETSAVWILFMDAAFKRMHVWFLKFKVWIYTHLEKPLLNAVKFINSLMPEKWAFNTDWDFSASIDENIKKIEELEKEIADNPYSNFGDAAKVTWGAIKEDFSGVTDWIRKKWDSLWGSMGMKEISFPTGGFGPEKPVEPITMEEFMKQVTSVPTLINDYIYDPFERVDNLILDTWADLAMLQSHNLRMDGAFDGAEESMKLITDRLKEINKLMMTVGTNEGQIEGVKKLNATFANLKVGAILKDMNLQLADADKKSKLLGSSWDEISVKESIYNRVLSDLIGMNTEAFDTSGLEEYRKAILRVLGALQTLNQEEQLKMDKMQLYLELSRAFGDTLGGIWDKQLQRLEYYYEKDTAMAANNTTIKAQLEEEYDKKRRTLLRRQAILEKALALFSIYINTAKAIMESATKPQLIPFIKALGITQAAAVIAQPIPMKEGGIVPAGYPNDTYPALLSTGERVIPPDKLPEFNGMGKMDINVTIEGKAKGQDLYYVVKEVERRYHNSH